MHLPFGMDTIVSLTLIGAVLTAGVTVGLMNPAALGPVEDAVTSNAPVTELRELAADAIGPGSTATSYQTTNAETGVPQPSSSGQTPADTTAPSIEERTMTAASGSAATEPVPTETAPTPNSSFTPAVKTQSATSSKYEAEEDDEHEDEDDEHEAEAEEGGEHEDEADGEDEHEDDRDDD